MTEQLISFETAKLAKEKGFNEATKMSYADLDPTPKPNIVEGRTGVRKNNEQPYYSAPTQSLLQKWLREEHKIDVVAIWFDRGYLFSALKRTHTANRYEVNFFDTYEQALEAGLQKALELI